MDIVSAVALILTSAAEKSKAATEIDFVVAFAPGAISTDAATFAIDREADMLIYKEKMRSDHIMSTKLLRRIS